jgi:hypothetical protein
VLGNNGQNQVVLESIHAMSHPPRRDEVQLDVEALSRTIGSLGEPVAVALAACTEELLAQLDRDQLSGLLQALLQPLIQPEWAPPKTPPPA